MLRSLLTILVVGYILSSCNEPSQYEGKIDLKNGYWVKNDVKSFEFDLEEEENNSRDFLVNYRVGADYPFQNLYVKYQLKDSLGKVISEKLQNHILFDPKTGYPLGDGLGDMYLCTDTLFHNMEISRPGLYELQLQQYMRLDTLKHLNAIGLRIVSRP